MCESFGGTYIWENLTFVAGEFAFWTCRNFTVIDDGDPPNFIDNFTSPCVADVLAAGFATASITWTVIDLAGSGNVMECRGIGPPDV